MTETSDRKPLDFRDPALIVDVMSYLIDAGDDPIPVRELEEVFDAVPAKTLEGTVYDLRRFGAIYKANARKGSPATLRATELGRAWLDRRALPRPGAAELEPEVYLDDLLEFLNRVLDGEEDTDLIFGRLRELLAPNA